MDCGRDDGEGPASRVDLIVREEGSATATSPFKGSNVQSTLRGAGSDGFERLMKALSSLTPLATGHLSRVEISATTQAMERCCVSWVSVYRHVNEQPLEYRGRFAAPVD